LPHGIPGDQKARFSSLGPMFCCFRTLWRFLGRKSETVGYGCRLYYCKGSRRKNIRFFRKSL